MLRILPLSLSCLILLACAGSPPAAPSPASAAGAVPASQAPAAAAKEQQAEERATLEQDLRQKQRELDYARVEVRTGEIDQRVRLMGAEMAVVRARQDLELARRDLELFRTAQRPKELEERRIGLDRQAASAEEAKDELGQLEAMYQEEEFAKATKELVLKRSRTRLALAERDLAVGRRELELLEQHTLPDKERELQRKVEDAEQAAAKAALELDKARMETDLAARKLRDRMADLERDIAELQRKLAAKPGAGA